MRYRGSGIAVSAARHIPRRTVGASGTIAVAALSALVTLWLGWLAHLSGGVVAPVGTMQAGLPDQLAVVHVQPGETLQQLAGRMVPGVPVGQVVERIQTLNHLDSSTIAAGQTLIAPIG